MSKSAANGHGSVNGGNSNPSGADCANGGPCMNPLCYKRAGLAASACTWCETASF